MVPPPRLELGHRRHQNLNLACLPIPPERRTVAIIIRFSRNSRRIFDKKSSPTQIYVNFRRHENQCSIPVIRNHSLIFPVNYFDVIAGS